MITFLEKIDFPRLLGINRILGIDWTEKHLRVIELEKRGSILNRYTVKFSAVQAFSHEFSSSDSEEQQIAIVKKFLFEHNIKTKYAVTSIRSLGVKTVSASIPSSVSSIDEWIHENYSKLVKLPLPMNQITSRYEILEKNDVQTTLEIVFVRNQDVEKHKEFIRQCGLELLSLGVGVRDALNSIMVDRTCSGRDLTCCFVEEAHAAAMEIRNGKRTETKGIPLSGDGASLDDSFETMSGEIVVCGEGKLKTEHTVFKPFHQPSRYTLSAGLALRGFIPELSPVDVLRKEDKDRIELLTYKNLSQRLALGLGTILIALLALPFVASAIIQHQRDGLDEQFAAGGKAYAEVAVLETQVHRLQKRAEGSASSSQKSNVAKVMHSIAASVPADLWLDKLSLTVPGTGYAVSVQGFTRSNESLAEFLRKLQSGKETKEVSLIRAGASMDGTNYTQASNGKKGFISFEISARLAQ